MHNTKKNNNQMHVISQISELGEIWIDLTKLVTRHLWIAIMAFFALCLMYSKLVFSPNYYTDTEIIINNPNMYYNWMEIGRFGLVLLKKLGGLSWYNPYFEAILFLFCIWLDVMFIALLCIKIWDNADERVAIIAGLVCMIYPTFAEQFGFRFQAFEIVFSIFILLVASIYLYKYINNHNRVAFLVSLLLSIGAYSIYQSNVNLQITIYMFLFASCTYGNKCTNVKRNIGVYIIHFLITFVLYEIIANCMPSDTYLADQVMWGKEGILKIVKNILSYAKLVLLGGQVFYTCTYFICAVLMIGTIILSYKKKMMNVWCLLGILGLMASPLFLSCITGIASSYRAQMMLPLANACMFYLGYEMIKSLFSSKKIILLCFMWIGIFFLLEQAEPLTRLVYTHDCIGQEDQKRAIQMMIELDKCQGSQDKPIAILGQLDAKTNKSCYTQQDCVTHLCISVFELDYWIEPQYFFSTSRILGYFEMLGSSYKAIDSIMIEQAKEFGKNMTCWPQNGCVQEFEDFIVLKLSD